MRTQQKWILTLLLAVPSLGLAQDSNPPAQPPSTGWRKFGGTNTGVAGMAGVAGTAGLPGTAMPAEPLPQPATLALPAGSCVRRDDWGLCAH